MRISDMATLKNKQFTTELPSVDLLDTCFSYDELSGILYWKERPVSCFKNYHGMRVANSKFAGHAVGSINGDGYLQTKIEGRWLLVSRIIWKIVTRNDPVGYLVDHANRDRTDNRFQNLRLASHSENSTNRVRKKSGITWNKSCNKWQAQFTKDGKSYYLGVFENKDNAIFAADKARSEAFNGFYNSEVSK